MKIDEAIKWLQLDIDMMKFDPTTGEDAYLNADARKVLEAKETALKVMKNVIESENLIAEIFGLPIRDRRPGK